MIISNFKLKNGNFRNLSTQAGMTYVELIVVLSIFAVMTSVVLFNYGQFQSKVDIKNLGDDVALKIVEAQKSAISGLLPPSPYVTTSTWKPSYGIYFDLATSNKSFIYFADLDDNGPQNGLFDGSDCTGECIEKISISKAAYISGLDLCAASCSPFTGTLSVTFKRPNSGVTFKDSNGSVLSGFDYLKITLTGADSSVSTNIDIYPSGRIQLK